MDSTELTRQFAFGALAVLDNLEGLTHEETLARPFADGSSLHWVFGHVVGTRNFFFPMLGLGTFWTKERAARYERGSSPAVAVPVPLDELRDDFRTSQEQLVARLAEMSPAELAAPAPDTTPEMMGRTVGATLLSFAWHEAYHAGQLGLLRRLAGRAGKLT